MQAEQELTKAIDVLYATLRQQPERAPAVAEHAGRLEHFHVHDRLLSFTLTRHPHRLGHLSQGMESTGYFLIEQRYVFDLDQQTITLTQEVCTGWEADIEALVYEEVETLLDYAGLQAEYEQCTSEAEVCAYAEREADAIVAEFPETMLFAPQAPRAFSEAPRRWEQFCGEFMTQWRVTYVSLVLEKWKEQVSWG